MAVVFVVSLLVGMAPIQASAECAWALWINPTTETNGWRLATGPAAWYASKADCQSTATYREAGTRGQLGDVMCLPQGVEPIGQPADYTYRPWGATATPRTTATPAGVFDWLQRYALLTPVVQFILATVFAAFIAEKWQRWRQRRDFQYKTLTKFSELSYEMTGRIAELLVGRGKLPDNVYREKQREMVTRWTVFLSMRGEVMASFGRDFILRPEYQGVFTALNTLRAFLREPAPVPEARFEPEQEKFLANREAVVALMVRAMGLVSWRHWRTESRNWKQRLAEADTAAASAAAPAAPQQGVQ
jgi:hypothetical protein